MKTLVLLLLCLALTSCTALPAEERAFAVVLSLEKAEEWTVRARIPTYQTGGGYATITGTGGSLDAALSDLDAHAPMRLHLSQLRLVVLSASLGADLPSALQRLAARPDMRLQAAIAVHDGDMDALMEAMKPTTGTRLSKSLDVLRETRIAQGTAPAATLSAALRMGQRQTPVLARIILAEESPDLLGGYPLTTAGSLAAPLDPNEMRLVSLILGDAKNPQLTLPGGTVTLRDTSARVSLQGTAAAVKLTARIESATLPANVLQPLLAEELLALATKLTVAGCDPFGLGRQVICHMRDITEWQVGEWQTALPHVTWSVQTRVHPAT